MLLAYAIYFAAPYICCMTLQERDKAVLWHPFTHFKFSPDPIPIVKGDAVYLVSENGDRYIDAISSWWVTIHGHAHPYIAEKIFEQAKKLEQVIFAGFTHEPAITLAERLISILPPTFAKIFYSDNGSTAVEVAVKMALQFWWNQNKLTTKKKILAFNHSYHGDTFGAMSVSDRSVFTAAFHEKLFEVVFIDPPETGNIENIITLIEKDDESIAGFIYEPLIQGAGGMKVHDAALLNRLLQVIQQNNIICIADEVMTGFGRTGKIFASEHLNVKPDLICLSKGLTGGSMALGVTAVSGKIADAFVSDDKLKTFFHGHSFTANPIACSAALASLDLLQTRGTADQIQMICEAHAKFAGELKTFGNSYNIKNIRQQGTILAFEIENGKDEYLNNISALVTALGLKKGVYLRPLGNTLYIMPPYCISNAELELIYIAIKEILIEIQTPS